MNEPKKVEKPPQAKFEEDSLQTKLEKEKLKQILKGINQGVYELYLNVAYNGKFPLKAILEEAKSDLETVLDEYKNYDSSHKSKLSKYAEIVDLLIDIPVEDLMREKAFCKALHTFTKQYDLYLSTPELLGSLLKTKLQLTGEKSKLESKMEFGQGSNSTQKLIKLADKYRELFDMEYKLSEPFE